MNKWVLMFLIIAGILAVVIVPVAIFICVAGWPTGDEQFDEENPRSLDQSRRARESRRNDGGWVWFYLLSQISVSNRWCRVAGDETLSYCRQSMNLRYVLLVENLQMLLFSCLALLILKPTPLICESGLPCLRPSADLRGCADKRGI